MAVSIDDSPRYAPLALGKTSDELSCRKLLLNSLWGLAICVIIASGFLMAIAVMHQWFNCSKCLWAPSPDWHLALAGIFGSLLSSVLFGLVLFSDDVANYLRGSLEYTTLMIIALNGGQRFEYASNKTFEHETVEQKLAREIHQLKVEAGLVGWTAEEVDSQIVLMRDASDSSYHKQLTMKATLKEFAKNTALLTRTLGAMPLLSAVFTVLLLLVFFGGAILAFGITYGVIHMPNEKDDAVWVEYIWQIVNFSFTIVTVWKGPQRARLIYHLHRHSYEVSIDGQTRSLLVPGVLLTKGEVVFIAWLRMGNVICQYAVNFFQWAWFRPCWQEAKDEYKICSVRPGWGIMLFLAMAIICDHLSNAALFYCITRCEFTTWPAEDVGVDPDIATLPCLEPFERIEGEGQYCVGSEAHK